MIIEDTCTSATGRNLSATVVRGYSGRRSIKESLPMWYGKTVRNACAPSINCYSVYKICPGKWQIIWLHLHKTVQQIQCWYVSPAWRNADGGREYEGRGGYVSRGRKKRRGKKFVWRNKKKSMKRRMMAPRRLELFFFFFFFYLVLLPERDRDIIYIYTRCNEFPTASTLAAAS